MNVMCVKPIMSKAMLCQQGHPEVGDIDTVVRAYEILTVEYICLERFGTTEGYKASHFSPLQESPSIVLSEHYCN